MFLIECLRGLLFAFDFDVDFRLFLLVGDFPGFALMFLFFMFVLLVLLGGRFGLLVFGVLGVYAG